jgi:hypothetical protein
MSDKIITEEILWEKLEEKGIKQPHETDHEEKLAKVLDHWDAEITSRWDDGCTRWFYMESTADGYEVYVCTWGREGSNISISEDIYYYEHGWLDDMPSAIKDGAKIYFSELEDDNYEFVEAINETYEHYFEDKVEEMQDELLDEGWVLQNDVVIDA